MPSPFYTLTLNPLAEHTFHFADWETGATQRADRAVFQAGGKGINVVRMLARLKVPATALTFVGGESGAACIRWLQSRGLPVQSFSTTAATRIGLVVRSPERPETTFLGPDAAPDAEAIRACADYLSAQPDGSVLAFCGSAPQWDDRRYDPLRAALDAWARRGVLVGDTYGAPLRWLTQRAVDLVKVNSGEFRTLDGPDAPVAERLRHFRKTLPVRRWIVTAGGDAVWMQDESGEPACLMPPGIKMVSPTGSGDVLLAALLDSLYLRGGPLRQALPPALRLAAANAADPGIAEFPLPDEDNAASSQAH